MEQPRNFLPSTTTAISHSDMLAKHSRTNTMSHPAKRFKTPDMAARDMAEPPQTGKPTLDIPVEIILNIVEQMGWDPVSIGKFMRTSKAHSNAVLQHEASLCLSFAANVPHDNKPILSSAPTLSTYAHDHRIDRLFSNLRRITEQHFPNSPHPGPRTIPSWHSFRRTFFATMSLLYPTTALPWDIETLLANTWNAAYKDWGRGDIHSLEAAIPSTGFVALPRVATPLPINSFPWIEELHLRQKIMTFLPKCGLLACDHRDPRTRAIYHTAQPLCHHYSESISLFKTRGISILYQMWDARLPSPPSSSTSTSSTSEQHGRCTDTCQAPRECEARNNVEAWITKQSEETLACLLQTVWVASQLYEPPPPKGRRMEGRCEHGGHDPSFNNFNTAVPTAVPSSTHSLAERTREWETVERQCIFRELCFEAGPWFMYCARPLPSSPITKDLQDVEWAQQRLEKGISRLHAYESGAPLVDEEMEDEAASDNDSTTGQPDSTHAAPVLPRMTLQATLLNRFCELRECDLRHGWDEVFYVNAVQVAEEQCGIDEERAREERRRELEERERMREQEEKWREGEKFLGGGKEGVEKMAEEFEGLEERAEKALEGEGEQGDDMAELWGKNA